MCKSHSIVAKENKEYNKKVLIFELSVIIPHLEQAIASTCDGNKANVRNITFAVTEPRINKEQKGSNCWKKGGPLVKKMAQYTTGEKSKDGRENGEKRERRQTRLSPLSLWYDKFMHSSCVCQSKKARGVCRTISQGGRREERKGEKQEKKKKEERAETLSSNSRKWVDRGRLCSLCGFNESTVFRTRRGTRELA